MYIARVIQLLATNCDFNNDDDKRSSIRDLASRRLFLK